MVSTSYPSRILLRGHSPAMSSFSCCTLHSPLKHLNLIYAVCERHCGTRVVFGSTWNGKRGHRYEVTLVCQLISAGRTIILSAVSRVFGLDLRFSFNKSHGAREVQTLNLPPYSYLDLMTYAEGARSTGYSS